MIKGGVSLVKYGRTWPQDQILFGDSDQLKLGIEEQNNGLICYYYITIKVGNRKWEPISKVFNQSLVRVVSEIPIPGLNFETT